MLGTAYKEPTQISEFSVASGYIPKAGDIVYLTANGVTTDEASGNAIGVVAVLPTTVAKEPIKTVPVHIWGEVRVATQSGNVGDSVAGFTITRRIGNQDVILIC